MDAPFPAPSDEWAVSALYPAVALYSEHFARKAGLPASQTRLIDSMVNELGLSTHLRLVYVRWYILRAMCEALVRGIYHDVLSAAASLEALLNEVASFAPPLNQREHFIFGGTRAPPRSATVNLFTLCFALGNYSCLRVLLRNFDPASAFTRMGILTFAYYGPGEEADSCFDELLSTCEPKHILAGVTNDITDRSGQPVMTIVPRTDGRTLCSRLQKLVEMRGITIEDVITSWGPGSLSCETLRPYSAENLPGYIACGAIIPKSLFSMRITPDRVPGLVVALQNRTWRVRFHALAKWKSRQRT